MMITVRSSVLIVLFGVFGCSKAIDQKSAPRVAKAGTPAVAAKQVLPTSEQPAPVEPERDVVEPKNVPVEKATGTVPETTEEAAVEATPVALVRHEVQFEHDQVKYAIFAPAEAKIKPTQSPMFVHAGPRFSMRIGLGRFNLSTVLNSTISFDPIKIISQSPDVLIAKTQILKNSQADSPVDTVVFFMNRKFGHRDFTFTVAEQDYSSDSRDKFVFTLADCKAMIRAAEQMVLAETLPDDPAAILERFDATLRRDEGSIKSVQLSVIRSTDATALLLTHFPALVELDAKSIHMRDSTLASVLAKLPNLERLQLRDAEIEGETIPSFKGQPQLKSLNLGGDTLESLTEVGLQRLGELQALESLEIGSPKLTGTMLTRIPVLPNLNELQLTKLHYESVDPSQASGLAHFAKFPKLQSLNLSHLRSLSDAGLKGVASIVSLKELSIEHSIEITSAGLAPLTALKSLERLDLSQTEIDDTAVPTLTQLKSLRGLRIRRTKITDAGFEKLKAALPDCDVDYK